MYFEYEAHYHHPFLLSSSSPYFILFPISSRFSLLPLFLFLLYSPQVFSNFLDLLPLLLRFCWPWNQLLMGTQWPRAEPTRCIQMWPPAIITAFPALNKHSFNCLSSHAFMNLYIIHCTFLTRSQTLVN